ncbi:hypothetical protein ACIGEP_05140 [Microbacterium sp. NPDC077663]|uniref:hypothetical protein n=1 Tax=Microbacterium sp. NPDC077663 TaxID=3364189 RepID=UPI0037CB91AC
MTRVREAILVTGTVLVVLYAQLMYLVTQEGVALAYLALLACGLPVYFALAFGVGMSLGDLGDVLPVTGADSAAWLVLANTSFAAFFLVVGVSAGLVVRRAGRGTRALAAPRPAR